MTLKSALLVVLLRLPAPWFPEGHAPETPEERETRLAAIVEEVVQQVDEVRAVRSVGWSRAELGSLALVGGYFESAFAYEVHAGQPWPGRPPPFGDNGRAKCLWQLQRSAASVPFDEWRPFEPEEHDRLAGLSADATQRCVRAGVRALSYQIARCEKARDARSHGDYVRAGTVVYSEYHRPSPGCRMVVPTAGSLRRGRAYASFLAQVREELR